MVKEETDLRISKYTDRECLMVSDYMLSLIYTIIRFLFTQVHA